MTKTESWTCGLVARAVDHRPRKRDHPLSERHLPRTKRHGRWRGGGHDQACADRPETKRQKIGRGLRLPINQDGERSFDSNMNVLTVISNESHDDFAQGLQKEFEDDGFLFGVLTPQSFASLIIKTPEGNEEKCGHDSTPVCNF